MSYWLVKSEPDQYSWPQLLQEGRTSWDGVRNYQARNNLRAMKKGDMVLFYHSNEGLEASGLRESSRKPIQILRLPIPVGWLSISSRSRRWPPRCLCAT